MENDFVKIVFRGNVEFPEWHTEQVFLKNVRFVKSHPDSEIPIFTESKFKNVVYENATTQLLLQSTKTINYEVEVFFKENINYKTIMNSESITLVTRFGENIECQAKSIESELIEGTTLSKAKLTFTEILKDADSVTSHVETDVVEARSHGGRYCKLVLSNNIDIEYGDGFATGRTDEYFTVFAPVKYREKTTDEVDVGLPKWGQNYLIETHDCKVVALRLYLNETNFETFMQNIHRCFYKDSGGRPFGVLINYNNGTTIANYQAEVPIGYDDIEVNKPENLKDLTEVVVKLKMNFINHTLS